MKKIIPIMLGLLLASQTLAFENNPPQKSEAVAQEGLVATAKSLEGW